MQALGGMREQVSVLVNGAALHRHSVPDGGDGLVEPRRAIDNEEFAAKQLFDKLTRSSPYLGLDRVEPIVKKINSHFGRGLQRIRLRGIVRHGVVSSPTLQRRMIRG